jgi:hypothetical protein
MSLVAYCFKCGKKVTAHTTLEGNDLLSSLNGDDEVEVMHVSDNDGDHRWKLNRIEKDHLLNHIRSSN